MYIHKVMKIYLAHAQGSNLEWWIFKLIHALMTLRLFRETALDMASCRDNDGLV